MHGECESEQRSPLGYTHRTVNTHHTIITMDTELHPLDTKTIVTIRGIHSVTTYTIIDYYSPCRYQFMSLFLICIFIYLYTVCIYTRTHMMTLKTNLIVLDFHLKNS